MNYAYAVDGLHRVDGEVGSWIRDVVALHNIGAAGVIVLDGTTVNSLWAVEEVAELSRSVSHVSRPVRDEDYKPAL
jgi:hypothetical protein